MSATRRMMRDLPSAVRAEAAPPLGSAKACCTAPWVRPCGTVLRVTPVAFCTLAPPASLATASIDSPLPRRSTSLPASEAISARRCSSVAAVVTSALASSKVFCFSGVTATTSTQA